VQNMRCGILKMSATSGFLTAPKCTKFVFGRGSAPNPAGRAYDAPPSPLIGWGGRNLDTRRRRHRVARCRAEGVEGVGNGEGGGNPLPIRHPLDAFGSQPRGQNRKLTKRETKIRLSVIYMCAVRLYKYTVDRGSRWKDDNF